MAGKTRAISLRHQKIADRHMLVGPGFVYNVRGYDVFIRHGYICVLQQGGNALIWFSPQTTSRGQVASNALWYPVFLGALLVRQNQTI